MAAADALYEIMSIMLKKGPLSNMVSGDDKSDEGDSSAASEL